MDETRSQCHLLPDLGSSTANLNPTLTEKHMAKLPRFSLAHNEKNKKWELKHEGSGSVVKRFSTKAAATKGGVLEKAVGKMGSVRIRKRNGRIQEERTYPRSMDPRGRG
jgi:hypothetical protein